MEYAIEIKNLSKNYGDFCLDNISLAIPSGSVVGLIGENGAGKSTLISALLGLIKADYESLNIFGLDFASNEASIKQDIAVIFDTTHYDDEFTPPCFIGKICQRFIPIGIIQRIGIISINFIYRIIRKLKLSLVE